METDCEAAGTVVRAAGKDGPQVMAARRDGWSKAREQVFFDTLAATCNVRLSARTAGLSDRSAHKRRRADPGFAETWAAAIKQGYLRIEALLIENAEKTLAGMEFDADAPVPRMTVREAMHLLALHREAAHGGPQQRFDWRRRPRDIVEVRKSILAKLARIERAQAREDAAAQAAGQAAGQAAEQAESGGDPA